LGRLDSLGWGRGLKLFAGCAAVVLAIAGRPEKDWLVYPLKDQRQVFHIGRHKDEAAPGDGVFLILQPKLYFPVQFFRVFRILTYKTQRLPKIMRVGNFRLAAVPRPEGL
jgi:hypothetical protein